MPYQHNKQFDTINELDLDNIDNVEQSSIINKTDHVRKVLESSASAFKKITIFEQLQSTNSILEIPEILDDFTESLEQEFEQVKEIIFNELKKSLKEAFKLAVKQKPAEIQIWEKKYLKNTSTWLRQTMNIGFTLNRLDWDFIIISSIAILNSSKFNRPSDIHDTYLKISKIFGVKN